MVTMTRKQKSNRKRLNEKRIKLVEVKLQKRARFQRSSSSIN